jgi:hypothetical protein
MTELCDDHSDVRSVLAWAEAIVTSHGVDVELLSAPKVIFSESDLLREIAWVTLCSGFREKIVRSLFGKISLCFFDWVSAATIANHADICVATAMDAFHSTRNDQYSSLCCFN